MAMATPDTGGTRRAGTYAKALDTELIITFKQRAKANVVEKMTIIGDVSGRDIVLVDDIIDTAGTITKAADMMMDRGATSVRAVCTHAILSGKAYEVIEKSKITKVIVTDTIPLRKKSSKIEVLSTAPLFADVIKKVLTCESISTHFKFNV
jgi:ribose-phosphate pyrophosphokinase